MTDPLAALSEAGVSVWLDDLSRERIDSGNLAELIEQRHVVGVTTNPTIFAAAFAEGERYTEQMRELKAADVDLETAVFELMCTDVQRACDILRPVYDRTDGLDGRVSIEVDPGLARDTDGTVDLAARLWKRVDRPNLFIKIPATREGLPAIAATIAEGISVNVTLIFSLERYRDVMDAYLYGLEQAAAEGRDLSAIESVASFFVSRVDSEVDPRLPEDSPLRGKAAIANARLAYEACEQVFSSERAQALLAKGAKLQRPLWASTGVKDPSYPDTLYVRKLIVADSVNTMPEKTLLAFADHGDVPGDTVTGRYDEAREVLAELERLGISYDEVVEKLEDEGLEKFDASWAELLDTVRGELDKA
ncbi:transaldolase [Aeromicrobium sp. YIM 150415]|uniref:transaldolase n=1 Tax=Aeromicrobium sp. YIM 150415 TaxID=2803912 RepID=UPI001963DEFE|nr:transaldolase [Aeromicrobium sp. YIM 150415]MBM9462608.1 transaldolase [Aeromicrobium sp. YIM 150415]